MNNTSKDIAASRVSHIGLTMTYYVGEIFNTNKTNESTKFLENSLDKQGIPLTLEHAGLEYHCGYGKNEDINKNVAKIGNVDEIFKKDDSYYAKIRFENDTEPSLLDNLEKWYLSASDDRDNVFEIGLTQDPRRIVSSLVKMSDSTDKSTTVGDNATGVQRLLNMQIEAKEEELKRGSQDQTSVVTESKLEDINVTPEMQQLIQKYKQKLAEEQEINNKKHKQEMKKLKEQLKESNASRNLSNELIQKFWNTPQIMAAVDQLDPFTLKQVKDNSQINKILTRVCNGKLLEYNDRQHTGMMGVVEAISELPNSEKTNSNDDNAPNLKKRKFTDERLQLAKELRELRDSV